MRARLQKMLAQLGEQLDRGVFAINVPDTAYDQLEDDVDSDFTCDPYFNATIQNIEVAKRAFNRPHVIQYVNFWPCEWNNDRLSMVRLSAFAKENEIGPVSGLYAPISAYLKTLAN